MTLDYRNRDQLYRSAVEALGEEEADTSMASLPPMDWSEMATKADLADQGALLRTDLANEGALLRAEIQGLEERMDLRFEGLEHRMTATFESALRQQTQWVFAAVVAQCLAIVVAILTLA